MPAFSNKEAVAVVESELGVPFEDVYELVEPEPIAAASIGQVPEVRTVGSLYCSLEVLQANVDGYFKEALRIFLDFFADIMPNPVTHVSA